MKNLENIGLKEMNVEETLTINGGISTSEVLHYVLELFDICIDPTQHEEEDPLRY